MRYDMGITNSNKELSVSQIQCGDSFQVKLSLTAAPDIVNNPTDIVLALDRSGSMAGSPLANMKSGARKFIDIIADSTGGTQDGQIGYGSRIGIVSFADTAVQNTQLITSVSQLKDAVNSLTAGGRTNHGEAFQQASAMFDPASANAKVIVLFTDGVTTTGPDPLPIAEAAKAEGIIIYCIGLSGTGGIDETALNAWASAPPASYVSITPDDAELEKLFEDLAQNIVKPGATDILINEQVNDCFQITAVSAPAKGTATLTGPQSLQWRIDELGVTASEGAVLEFTVQHNGQCSGTIEVNDSITYSDNDGNIVTFPSPAVTVDCGTVVTPEPCPEPVEITIGGCQDVVEWDAGDLELSSLGRILQLSVTLKNICPYKRVALAVVLSETGAYGMEYPRGMKTLTIPAHTQSTCQDVTVRCIRFVLPEDLDVSGGTPYAICNERVFQARIFANYIDNNFSCCDVTV